MRRKPRRSRSRSSSRATRSWAEPLAPLAGEVSASRSRFRRPLEEGRLHSLGGLAQVGIARFSPRPAGVEIGLEAVAQRPVLGEQIEAGLLDRFDGVSQLRL